MEVEQELRGFEGEHASFFAARVVVAQESEDPGILRPEVLSKCLEPSSEDVVQEVGAAPGLGQCEAEGGQEVTAQEDRSWAFRFDGAEECFIALHPAMEIGSEEAESGFRHPRLLSKLQVVIVTAACATGRISLRLRTQAK